MVQKYWKCCVAECTNDEGLVQFEVTAHPRIKGIYVCFDHTLKGSQLRMQLNQGTNPTDLGININNVVYKTGVTIQPTKQVNTTTDDWEFTTDYNRWINTEGKLCKIQELSDKELEDAVVAIQEANISRVTKRIEWIKKLKEIITPTQYFYPKEKLNIGLEEAYSKLEEFYEVMSDRGLTP